MINQRSNQSNKPKLLFLCQTLPYPPDGGVHVRTFNIMRLLSREFDITAFCFFRAATRADPEAVSKGVEGLSGIARVHAFPIPQDRSRIRLVWDHLRSIASGRVYTRFVYESRSFRMALKRVLEAEPFDVIHLDSMDLSGYLPLLEDFPVVCTHHNVESDLLRRRSDTEPLPLNLYMRHQARLMQKEESRQAERVALNAVVSREDETRLRAIAPEARVTVVPNGVDTSKFQPTGDARNGVVFVGGYSWYPNRDGMKYFAEEILPLVRKLGRDPRVVWVGRSSSAVQREYDQRHGITLTGYVDDIRPYVEEAACYVVPLRVGGGTRLKILDAWAMGKAVVSTTVGCEGLAAADGENILIRDEPADFATAVNALLSDVDLRRRLGEGGRRTAEEVYDWDVIGRGMIREYKALVRSSSSPAA